MLTLLSPYTPNIETIQIKFRTFPLWHCAIPACAELVLLGFFSVSWISFLLLLEATIKNTIMKSFIWALPATGFA